MSKPSILQSIGLYFTPQVGYHNGTCTKNTSNDLQLHTCQSDAQKQVIFVWIIAVTLLLTAGTLHKLFPLSQFAHVTDTRYHYPFFHESVPSTLCFILGGALPVIILMLPYIIPYGKLSYYSTPSQDDINHSLILEQELKNTSYQPLSRIKNDISTSNDISISSISLPSDIIPANQQHPNPKHQHSKAYASPLINKMRNIPLLPSLSSSIPFMGIFTSTVLGVFMSLALGTFFTTLFKTISGRPRPNAIALSFHIFETHQLTDKYNALLQFLQSSSLFGPISSSSSIAHNITNTITDTIISPLATSTNTYSKSIEFFTQPGTNYYVSSQSLSPYLANDALRSFPSGHSCFAFAGLVYLSLVLFTRYMWLSRQRDRYTYKTPVISCMALFNPLFVLTKYDSNMKCWGTCHHHHHRNTPSSLSSSSSHSPTSSSSSSSESLPLSHHDGEDEHHQQEVSPSSSSPSSHHTHHHPHTTTTTSPLPPLYSIPPFYLALFIYIVIPVSCAGLIAISRITDYWHHSDDVLAGSLLGVSTAFISFLIFH